MNNDARTTLLYHFCRLQVPGVALPPAAFERHLRRTFELFRTKEPAVTWDAYLDGLYTTDWYLCCACLEGDGRAWEHLFAARTGRTDCLLVDALRARAARLYPRDEVRPGYAVAGFWSPVVVSESCWCRAVMAPIDWQRALV